ncbi:MAG TPA: copper-binding protein [Alphaproteobacteria bacterium]|nr:copper-binding protein [Alphaproteobacteria bacterium]
MTRFASAFTIAALAALSGCANPSSAATPAGHAQALGVDLGPSGTVTQVALTGEGHERRAPEGSNYRLVHEGHDDAHATGTVNAIDTAARKLNISHQAIPEIGWPAMTMDFPVAPSVDLKSIKAGDHVNFTLEKGTNGMYQIEDVHPAGSGK